jgi:aspartyl-tRNA synthetase
MLTKSTPEGARDYLVPSRIHPGKFYALPQSPQQYKQLLMLSGYDRYMQIVRCFRDEDLRADRQPEFTQIDLEMSFVDVDDVIAINEGFLKRLFKHTLGLNIETPFQRIPYAEVMDRFGSDKPDLRFGLELVNISDLVENCGFQVFTDPIKNGGSVRLICVPGGGDAMPRKKIDSLVEYVKTYRAKGLAWMKLSADGTTSSFAKFMTDKENAAILERAGAKTGDLVLIVADSSEDVVFASLGALRCEVARRLDLIPKDVYRFLWVTEFPMFEYSEEEERFVAKHHPFTAPMDEDIPLLAPDTIRCRATASDVVLNGQEIGGVSIRINTPEMQETQRKR